MLLNPILLLSLVATTTAFLGLSIDFNTAVELNRKTYTLCTLRLASLKGHTCESSGVQLLSDHVRSILGSAINKNEGPISVMGFRDGQLSTHSYAEVDYLLKLVNHTLPLENGQCPMPPACVAWTQEQSNTLAALIGADPDEDRAVIRMSDYSKPFMYKKIASAKHLWEHVEHHRQRSTVALSLS